MFNNIEHTTIMNECQEEFIKAYYYEVVMLISSFISNVQHL